MIPMAKWWTLVAVSVATFMLLLDITIVNVALPDIERSLDASFSDLQWVIDAYALSLAALLLTGGSLADLLGRRLIFVIGLAVFTAASLLCGLSGSPLALTLARALQGVGGAFMFATSLALLASGYQGADRGTAFGVWGAVTGASVAVGPLVGGVLTDAIGWEAIFFVNVPVGLGAIALTLAKVQESRDPRSGRLDWPGFATFSAALFLLVFALIRGNPEGWGSPMIVAMLVGGAVLLGLFVAVERSRRFPMLDLSLFRNPAFGGASVAAFVLSAALFSMFLYLTLYIQNILGYSPLESGLRFLPTTVASFVLAPVSGKLADRYGARWFIGGGPRRGRHRAAADVRGRPGRRLDRAAGRLARGRWRHRARQPGAGVDRGRVVEPQRAGMASGINSTFRQIGIATGIAGWGAIFQHVVEGEFIARAAAAGLQGGSPAGGGSVADAISFGRSPRWGRGADAPRRAGLRHRPGPDPPARRGRSRSSGALLCLVLVRRGDLAGSGAPADAKAAAA